MQLLSMTNLCNRCTSTFDDYGLPFMTWVIIGWEAQSPRKLKTFWKIFAEPKGKYQEFWDLVTESWTRHVTCLEKAMADGNNIRIVRRDGNDHAHKAVTYPPSTAINASTQDGLYDELRHDSCSMNYACTSSGGCQLWAFKVEVKP